MVAGADPRLSQVRVVVLVQTAYCCVFQHSLVTTLLCISLHIHHQGSGQGLIPAQDTRVVLTPLRIGERSPMTQPGLDLRVLPRCRFLDGSPICPDIPFWGSWHCRGQQWVACSPRLPLRGHVVTRDNRGTVLQSFTHHQISRQESNLRFTGDSDHTHCVSALAFWTSELLLI